MLCNFEMSQNNIFFFCVIQLSILKPQYHHHCKDCTQNYITVLWTPAISYLDIYTQESFLTEQ